jgi:rSAM/selenodomain-associated transferase 1
MTESRHSCSTARLIVFARCPELGRCKTRLIPVLGERGATAVHEALVHRTMSWMEYPIAENVSVEIQYAGDDLENLRLLCGNVARVVTFRPQQEGALGQRLSNAFSTAFQEGASKVAIIGTDCPQLTHVLILKAFVALENNDVVIGPATDGGYYLVAARGHFPELFADIAWGGAKVLDDTLTRASSSQITVELLEPLADVDRPEDVTLLMGEDFC